MKPLLIVPCFNRLEQTKVTLAALAETTKAGSLAIHVIDTGSTDGTRQWLSDNHNWFTLHLLPKNRGLYLALNYVIKNHRAPGQHVIKLYNDIECKTKGWLDIWLDFLAHYKKPVAMISPDADKFHKHMVGERMQIGSHKVYFASQLQGSFILHTGAFMDRVGHFDVLTPWHLYGWGDVIMSFKARKLKWAQVVVCSVHKNHTTYPVTWSDKIDRVRKTTGYYGNRVKLWSKRDDLYTKPDGYPRKLK